LPPIPAPRSSSHIRTLVNDENNDDQERARRNSTEILSRRKESPVPRSVSSNFDENEQINSIDEQTPIRSITGKKKKVIGAGRHRLYGDSLPPLAPSSAASRRDDLTQSKGPPVGTPRPQPVVAQWAITSPSPHSTAEKLTTIASDSDLDHDEEKYKSLKPTKRTVSPHPIATTRIINDKKPQLTTINNDDHDNNNDYKKLSRQKRQTHSTNNNNNNDDDDDDNTAQRSSSVQKSRSKLSDDDEEDEFVDHRKKTNSREQDQYSKQRYDRNNDNDNDDDDAFDNVSSRRAPSSTLKTAAGDSSHRSHSKTNGNVDDDDFNNVSSRRAPSSARKTATGDSSHRSHSKTNGNVDDDLW